MHTIEELRNLGCEYKDVIIFLQAAAFYGALDFGEYVACLTKACSNYGYDVTFNELKSLFDGYVTKLRRFANNASEKEAKKSSDSKLTTKLMNFVLGNRSSTSVPEETKEDHDVMEDNVESLVNDLSVSMIKYSESTGQLTADMKPPLHLTCDNSLSPHTDQVKTTPSPSDLYAWRVSEAHSREVVCVSASEGWVVSGDVEGKIVISSSRSRRVECTREHSKPIVAVVCLPGDSGVLSCCEKGAINIWNYPKSEAGEAKAPAGKASPMGDEVAYTADSTEGAADSALTRSQQQASTADPATPLAASSAIAHKEMTKTDGEGGMSKVEKAALYDEINSPAVAPSRWNILKRMIRKKSASIKLSHIKVSSFASNALTYKSDHVPLICAVGGTCGELRVVSKWGNEFFETFNLNAVYAVLSTANTVTSVSLFVPPDSIFKDDASTYVGDEAVGGSDAAKPQSNPGADAANAPPPPPIGEEMSPRGSVFSLKRKPKPTISQTRAHNKGMGRN
jgi:hypothetical protein